MKRTKRFVLSSLIVVFTLSICYSTAAARSSDYLMSHYAELYAGDDSGELNLDFFVQATKNTTLLGIYKIKFYEENGDYVTTVWGTVINGLLSNDGGRYYGSTYTFDRAEPGVSYYAVVTFMANDSQGGDTYDFQTPAAKAP